VARSIAFFGGSFDPPHLAHLMACLVALSTEPIDEVWMAPTFRHAFGKPMAPFADRVAMCERAARPFGGAVVVSRVEEEVAAIRGAESRTYHTLRHLRDREPDLALRLLVGEDILAEKDAWHRWDDVVAMAPLLVVGRAGAPDAEGAPARIDLPAVSSSDIRARIAAGRPTEPLLPRAVIDYIDARGLYR
jgi:nicotinate-nucleotide adenylyltransferase